MSKVRLLISHNSKSISTSFKPFLSYTTHQKLFTITIEARHPTCGVWNTIRVNLYINGNKIHNSQE